MDKGTLVGLAFAVVGILGGLILEGGSVNQILQPTAAMIVLGGTLGAVMVQFPVRIFLAAMRQFAFVFLEKRHNPEAVIREIVGYANRARKEGIVSLDNELPNIQDPFLRKSLMLAVDGTEPQELRKMMELELENQAEHDENFPRVLEAAGGFSPTIGIIGAVLGLIQVMQNLDNIEEVGKGIAVAFVATIYGVGFANVLFLPAAGKLKLRLREEHIVKELMLEGVVSILEGMNPRMLDTKLRGYLADAGREKPAKPGKPAAAQEKAA